MCRTRLGAPRPPPRAPHGEERFFVVRRHVPPSRHGSRPHARRHPRHRCPERHGAARAGDRIARDGPGGQRGEPVDRRGGRRRRHGIREQPRGGFATDYRGIYRWVPYDGGATKEIRGVNLVYHTVLPGDLIVVETEDRSVLRDAVSGKDLQSVPLGRYAGAVGSSLFASVPGVQDVITLEMLVGQGDAVTRRPVTGLPADVRDAHVSPGTLPAGPSSPTTPAPTTPGSTTRASSTSPPARSRSRPRGARRRTSASSPARTALHRTNTDRITVTDRSTGATRDIVLPKPVEDLELAFVGDWLLYVRRGGLHATEPSPYHALTAYDLTKGGTRKLLDHVTSLAPGADGAPLVRGGSLTTGEGYYRLAPGAAGSPRRPSGRSSPSGPPSASSPRPHHVRPDPSHAGTRPVLELHAGQRRGDRHPAAHRDGQDHHLRGTARPVVRIPGHLLRLATRPAGGPARQRRLHLKLSVRPLNGIGPVLNTSGAFTVVRKANAHDFNDNGTPDVLTRDAQGRLWRHDTFFRRDPVTWKETWTFAPRALVGTGWQAYDRIEATGNLGGSGVGDVVGRDKAGVLWLHKGRGDGTFAARIRVGTGWGAYNQLAGGSDVTGDGRPDLLGVDKAGVLWIHPGTGKDTALRRRAHEGQRGLGRLQRHHGRREPRREPHGRPARPGQERHGLAVPRHRQERFRPAQRHRQVQQRPPPRGRRGRRSRRARRPPELRRLQRRPPAEGHRRLAQPAEPHAGRHARAVRRGRAVRLRRLTVPPTRPVPATSVTTSEGNQ